VRKVQARTGELLDHGRDEGGHGLSYLGQREEQGVRLGG
jgi:hypothetical protein